MLKTKQRMPNPIRHRRRVLFSGCFKYGKKADQKNKTVLWSDFPVIFWFL
jgi:hypothetical protein